MSVAFRHKILKIGVVIQILIRSAAAQGIAVAATAAWSSQIVAFWGAIIIAIRSSARGVVTTAPSSIFSNLRVVQRSALISGALSRGNWFLQSGWSNGKLRTDVVVISWRSPKELQKLATQVSMQIETFAFNSWEVLVVGRQLRSDSTVESVAHWIKSPNHESLCPSRTKQTGDSVFPLADTDIEYGLALLEQCPKRPISEVVQSLVSRCDFQATRCAFMTEIYKEVENSGTQASFANVFTKVHSEDSPFQSLSMITGQYGANRSSVMKSMTRMYVLVHITVASAIGLMGAASGRGLAVWLLTIRTALQALGTATISGDDLVLSLVSIDKSRFHYETGPGSPALAGEIECSGITWWHVVGTTTVACVELTIIGAGWLYGALRVDRIPPSGALMSIRQRLGGRMVGVWKQSLYDYLVVGCRNLEVSVEGILNSPTYANSVLGLIATILGDHSNDIDESSAILVAECAFRRPATGIIMDYHLATDVLKYQYSGDSVVLQGEPATKVNVRSIYPWIQTSCCIVLTILCGCVSVVYAYYDLPSSVKIVAEILLATSACWFGILERTGGLPHNRDTTICFMVATLVASSVWYVGVRDIG
ncbi:nitrilase [Physcia stellaris]|nr:nitrilase [Physcia stellaris]